MSKQHNDLRAAYMSVFFGTDGDAVLADLRAEFYDRPITGDDETPMAYKAGGHGAILYILEMIRRDDDATT